MSLCREMWSSHISDASTRSRKLGIFKVKKSESLTAARILFVFSPDGASQALAKAQVKS